MRGAIFDVDGTLLDSMSIWTEITGRIFAKRNLTLDDGCIKRIQDMTVYDSCRYLINAYNMSETVEMLMEDAQKEAEKEYLHNIPLKEYAKEYLTKLHNEGVKLAVATSGFPELCTAALERCGVWKFFSGAAYSSEVGKDKSNPDIYLLAARRIGVEPRDCVVFEDILPGIYGAEKAGMQTVAVYDRTNTHITDELKKHAGRYIMSWKELL